MNAGIARISTVFIALAIAAGLSRMAASDSAAQGNAIGAVVSEGIALSAAADAAGAGMIRSLLDAARTGAPAPLTVEYPLDQSIFPREIIPPTFLWRDTGSGADAWLIDITFQDTAKHLSLITAGDPARSPVIDQAAVSAVNKPPSAWWANSVNWTPSGAVWSAIVENTADRPAQIMIYGFSLKNPDRVLSLGQVTLKSSNDPLSWPIFYRDVPLMPGSGKDGAIQPLETSAYPMIGWRLKDISRPDSRLVMTDLPTCANCHSFSLDGKKIAMDIDGPQGDKGAYAIAPLTPEIVIERDDVISWNYTFRDKPPEAKTIGFGSQISPDGRFVVSTVNEEIYVQNFLDYTFLQVFYVTRGILAWYSAATGDIKALPGADNPDYVHCDPVWSPDGTFLVFARARAQTAYPPDQPVAARANDPNELPMQYDLYRMPFNDGRGGTPVAIRGASANGMSNNFPKVSPDGKYIVFVKCKNGQLMRPDSRLWIVPAAGGEAREMACNTSLMNSWHSFAPNGRWMVFSSKGNTPYTQMFLTHIDENGMDSPPVLITGATADNRAVNLPEFVNIPHDGLMRITVPEVEFRRYMANGFDLFSKGLYREAVIEWEKTLAEDPDDIADLVELHNELGTGYGALGEFDRAVTHFQQALAINPQNGQAAEKLALVQWMAGDPSFKAGDDPRSRATRACELTFYQDPLPLDLLAQANAAAGNFTEAVRLTDLALYFAQEKDQADLVKNLQARLALYKQNKAYIRQ